MDAKWGCWAAGTLWTVTQLLWVPLLTRPELRRAFLPPGDLTSSGSPVIYPAPGAGSDSVGLPIRSTQVFSRTHTCLAFSVCHTLWLGNHHSRNTNRELAVWQVVGTRRRELYDGGTCLGNSKQFTSVGEVFLSNGVCELLRGHEGVIRAAEFSLCSISVLVLF